MRLSWELNKIKQYTLGNQIFLAARHGGIGLNPSTWKGEARVLEVPAGLDLHSEVKASLSYIVRF
jgi:hypothetical protein